MAFLGLSRALLGVVRFRCKVVGKMGFSELGMALGWGRMSCSLEIMRDLWSGGQGADRGENLGTTSGFSSDFSSSLRTPCHRVPSAMVLWFCMQKTKSHYKWVPLEVRSLLPPASPQVLN